MAPTPFMMDSRLNPSQRETLLGLARAAIRYGLEHATIMPITTRHYDDALREQGASFVTLTLAGELRGCIGSLEAHRPLAEDVVHNAFSAAFSDPRFMPLSSAELERIKIAISVLNPAEALNVSSEAQLIAQLRPGIDGLILQEGSRRGTFLPSVWEQLPDPEQFLHHLKLKAGLPAHHWSETLRFYRYTTTQFSE